jgi:predicted phage tail protein
MTSHVYRQASPQSSLVAFVTAALAATLLVLAMSMALTGIQQVSRPDQAPRTPEPGPEIPPALGLSRDAARTEG